jgi:hypothetical protein
VYELTKNQIATFIPSGNLPTFERWIDVSEKFLGYDALKYIQDKPHPRYDLDSISYDFNNYGFRGPSFDENADINILVSGCSWTFGIGVPLEHTWGELLAGHIRQQTGKTVQVWNIGQPGQSCDYATRTSLMVLAMRKVDLVVSLLPNASRKEYVTSSGEQLNLIPNIDRSVLENKSRIHRFLVKSYEALASPYMDLIQFYKNLELLRLSSEVRNIPFFFGTTDSKNLEALGPGIFRDDYIPYHHIDFGRDHAHPGYESNLKFADEIFNRTKNRFNAKAA